MKFLSWLLGIEASNAGSIDEATLCRSIHAGCGDDLDLYYTILRENRPHVIAMRQAANDVLLGMRG